MKDAFLILLLTFGLFISLPVYSQAEFTNYTIQDTIDIPVTSKIVIKEVKTKIKDKVVIIDFKNRDTIILSEKSDYHEIEFITTDTNNTLFQFRYALYKKNKLPKWQYIGNKNRIILTNIMPGNFILHIQGSADNIKWDYCENKTFLKIEAIFWKTKFSIITDIIASLLLLFLIYKWRTMHLRKINRGYKEKQLTAKKIEHQKEELTRKNKSITDSINYAKRIQMAMMPADKIFKSCFSESFILYLPKDIVSGDFYWISEVDHKTFVAAVDCTGHGVPGAFMSIIGFDLFRKITSDGINKPSDILNKVNDGFQSIFTDDENIALRDGMDLALCCIDKKQKTLEFAGAFNPLYIVRDNSISEIKGDRFSIGLLDGENIQESFTNHIIPLKNNDNIYMFTDGYVDQFGGPEGKKYKYRRFRHLLLALHHLPMEKQYTFLKNSIIEWKGNLDQVDDILVLGMRFKV